MTGRIVAAAFALTVLLAGCSPAVEPNSVESAEADVLRVGPLVTLNMLTLSQKNGSLARAVHDAGIELSVQPTFSAFAPAAQAMQASQIDLTSASTTALITALVGNPDIVTFAVERNNGDTQAIVAAPNTGISSVADLVGRTVAVNQGGTGEYLLLQALDQAGIPADRVNRRYLAPEDAASAFANGQVDAWATWDQYLAAARTTPGAGVVVTSADIGALNRTIHVVSRSFLEANPQAVRAAYDALVVEAAALAADPQRLAREYRNKGVPDDVAEVFTTIEPPTIVPADDAIRAEFEQVAAFYQRSGLSPTRVDVSRSLVDVRTLS